MSELKDDGWRQVKAVITSDLVQQPPDIAVMVASLGLDLKAPNGGYVLCLLLDQ